MCVCATVSYLPLSLWLSGADEKDIVDVSHRLHDSHSTPFGNVNGTKCGKRRGVFLLALVSIDSAETTMVTGFSLMIPTIYCRY